jgi:hypothetical protein
LSGTPFSANSCNAAGGIGMPGTTTSSTISISPAADVSAITGFGPGSGGQLYFIAWPTANNFNYKICNGTSAVITTSAATLWNVSVR